MFIYLGNVSNSKYGGRMKTIVKLNGKWIIPDDTPRHIKDLTIMFDESIDIEELLEVTESLPNLTLSKMNFISVLEVFDEVDNKEMKIRRGVFFCMGVTFGVTLVAIAMVAQILINS